MRFANLWGSITSSAAPSEDASKLSLPSRSASVLTMVAPVDFAMRLKTTVTHLLSEPVRLACDSIHKNFVFLYHVHHPRESYKQHVACPESRVLHCHVLVLDMYFIDWQLHPDLKPLFLIVL